MPKNHSHETEHDIRDTRELDYDIRAFADSDALARLDKMVLAVLKNGAAVPVENQFADYDFPVENRDRDRRVLNWARSTLAEPALQSQLETETVSKYSDADKLAYAAAYLGSGGYANGVLVAPYTFSAKLGDRPSMLDECIDRVRWDAMVASGQRSGKYDDNRKAADIADRAEDCAAIKSAITGDNPGLMCSHIGSPYLALVLAKAEEVQTIQHPVRTRKPKGEAAKKIPL